MRVLRELGTSSAGLNSERGDPAQEAVWREPGDRKPERSAPGKSFLNNIRIFW